MRGRLQRLRELAHQWARCFRMQRGSVGRQPGHPRATLTKPFLRRLPAADKAQPVHRVVATGEEARTRSAPRRSSVRRRQSTPGRPPRPLLLGSQRWRARRGRTGDGRDAVAHTGDSVAAPNRGAWSATTRARRGLYDALFGRLSRSRSFPTRCCRLILYSFLGGSLGGALWNNFFTAAGEYCYHANFRSPPWLKIVIQTPELHSIPPPARRARQPLWRPAARRPPVRYVSRSNRLRAGMWLPARERAALRSPAGGSRCVREAIAQFDSSQRTQRHPRHLCDLCVLCGESTAMPRSPSKRGHHARRYIVNGPPNA